MTPLLATGVTLGTFLIMEGVAWGMHKYVMHGFLWMLHKDHHVHEPGFFERNDTFFLIFAVPSSLLMFFGGQAGFNAWFFVGLGILLYGIAYFLVHDVFIHQRFKWLRRSDRPYFKAIRKAHKVHHKHLGKEEGECFGMLWVPFKYYREARKAAARQKAV